MRIRPWTPPSILWTLLALAVLSGGIAGPRTASAQSWPAYAGNPMHNGISPYSSQIPQQILWSTTVDLNPQNFGGILSIHYGSPVITHSNTIIVPLKSGADDSFGVTANRGSDGSLIWQLASDYIQPSHDWTLPFQVTLTRGSVVMAGAGGTVILRSNPDAATGTTSRLAFYGISNYNNDPQDYNNSVQIITPITADSAGNLFFGFLANGAPGNLANGLARIGSNGAGSWITAANASGDATMQKVAYNCAPALSPDGSKVYFAVNNVNGFTDGAVGYLVALNSKTLAPLAAVRRKDVAHPGNDALFFDDSTASPTVGTDGDVYYGVLENPFPSTHDRGWLLHFDANLATAKVPGAFGWDITASVVPSKAVPSYHGKSGYLILTKYNNYAELGGDGVNQLAVQDPQATMIDPISGASVMKTILTIIGPTPDQGLRDQGHPNAVREWCINTAVIDTHNKCAIVNSEDGNVYRWDFTTNSLTARVTLSTGIGEPYTPTVIGPDGKVYAINNSTLFACGKKP
jgi:hypothetical protein